MIYLYTTHCPKCTVLEKKLQAKGIDYKVVEDVDVMLSKDISSVPWLEIEGEMLDFKDAVEWVNGLGEDN